jgi:GntR family transcriptional regulator
MAQPTSRPRPGPKAEAARRVRDRLRDDIREGRFKDGRLPPEPTLMVEQHASRNAVRLALDLLRAEGLVARFQGIGTLVVGDNPVFMPLDPAVGFTDLLDSGPNRVRIHNHASFATAAPPGLARHLEIPVGAEVVFLERVLFLDERPLTLRSSWILGSVADPLLTGKVDLQQPVFAILEQGLELDLGVTEYSIEATLADEAVASLMNVPIGSQVALSQNRTRLADGRPVEYGYARSPGDRIRYMITVSRQSLCHEDRAAAASMVDLRRGEIPSVQISG